MSHHRRNTFQNELIDENRMQEEQKKKTEYQKLLLRQIEETSQRKKEEKEAKRKQEMEEMQKNEKEESNKKIKFKSFQIESNNPFQTQEAKNDQSSQKKGLKNCVFDKSDKNETGFPENPKLSENFELKKPQNTKNETEHENFASIKVSALPVLAPNFTSHKSTPAKTNSSSETKENLINFRNQIDQYLNRQIESLNSLSNSTQNCINTSLSKNYVLKHKNTMDYNTITETQNGYNPFFQPKNYSRNFPGVNNSSENSDFNKIKSNEKESELLQKLSDLKKSAILLAHENDEKKLELLKLKNEFKNVQKWEQEKSIEFTQIIDSLESEKEEQSLIYSYLAMNKSRQLNSQTDWVSFTKNESKFIEKNQNRNFVKKNDIFNEFEKNKQDFSKEIPKKSSKKGGRKMDEDKENMVNSLETDFNKFYDRLIPNF